MERLKFDRAEYEAKKTGRRELVDVKIDKKKVTLEELAGRVAKLEALIIGR